MQSASGTEAGTYSANGLGDMTGDGTITYGYDQRHLLTTINAGTVATFTHSADGFRTKSTMPAGSTHFFFAPEGSLISTYDADSYTDYVWLGHIPVAQVLSESIGNVLYVSKMGNNVVLTWTGVGAGLHVLRGTIGNWSSSTDLTPGGLSGLTYTDPGAASGTTKYWYKVNRQVGGTTEYLHANPVGLTNRITNSSGALVWKGEEFPFGAFYPPSVSGSSSTSLRFPGQYDEGNGLYENHWRAFLTHLGRYTQADPISVAGGTNLYVYVANDPLAYVDPLGLVTWNQQGPAYHPSDWDTVFRNCKDWRAHGCTGSIVSAYCGCFCETGGGYGANVSLNMNTNVWVRNDDPHFPLKQLLFEERKHVLVDTARFRWAIGRAERLESRSFSTPSDCDDACKAFYETTYNDFHDNWVHKYNPHPE